jgi:nucleoid DNA-binding protein
VKAGKRTKKAKAIDLRARMKVRATETRKAKNRRNPKTTPTYDAPAKKMVTSATVS